MLKRVVIVVVLLVLLTGCTAWNSARNYNPFPGERATISRGIQLVPSGSIFDQTQLVPGFSYSYCVTLRNYGREDTEVFVVFRDGDGDNRNGGINEGQPPSKQFYTIPGTHLTEAEYGETQSVEKEVSDNKKVVCYNDIEYSDITDVEKVLHFQATAQYLFDLSVGKYVCIPGRAEDETLCRNDGTVEFGNNAVAPIAIQNLRISFSPTESGLVKSTITFDLVDLETSNGYIPDPQKNPLLIDVDVEDFATYKCSMIEKKTGSVSSNIVLSESSVTVQCQGQGSVPYDDAGDPTETITRPLRIETSYPYVISTPSGADIKVARGDTQ